MGVVIRFGCAAAALLVSACAASPETDAVPPPYVLTRPPPVLTAPRPLFESERAPREPTATPAFRETTVGNVEQRRTAELLAEQQRRSGEEQPYVAGPRAQPTVAPQTYAAPPEPVYEATPEPASAVSLVSSGSVPLTTFSDTGTGNVAVPPMPAAARPGECFALVRRPEQYRSVARDYVSRPAYESVQVSPARYENSTQEIVVKEAHEQLEIVPASFRSVSEQVEVAPASTRYVAVEPEYETVTERIIERPARQVWKSGRGPIERVDNATGEIMCLVEEPPVYRNVTRRVLKNQPGVRETALPAEYRTVTRRVVDRQAEVRRVLVPGRTDSIPVRRLVEPARVQRVLVPEERATVQVRELAAQAQLEWRPILCETNMTRDTVQRTQQALKTAGYDPGPADGGIGAKTIDALNAYQRDKGLPVDRYLNMDTLRHLGVVLGQ